MTRRIFESDNNPNKPKRIMISNLVADYTNAFNEQEIDKITNTLYASYIDNPNTINNDLDSFMSEISNGKIEKYPFNKPKIDSTSFISSLYVDIPYPLVFNSNTIKMPFNGMGEYDYFRSDQNISELTINDDYLAFKMGNLRFVKPINDSLDDFFLNHSFDGCFQKNNHEEQKVILGIPKISIDSPLELLDIAKENGFLNDNSIEFNEDNLPYFIDNLTQDNYVSFSDSGVRAYSANIMGVIPYNAPVASINLDTSYAFEITGRDDIVLFYGEVNSLENAN